MDDNFRFSAELTKVNFLLENLYALVLRDAGATHDDVPDLSEEICRQARLPAQVYGPEDDADSRAAHADLVEQRIASFFARVRDRMRSAERE